MALQIRRGLNQERLNITPLAGEVIHVTDYKAKTKLISAVNVNDTITATAHGWVNGDQVMYRGPTANGLTQGTLYYIKAAATNTFQFSTLANLSDTVNITATASGLNYPVVSGPRDADGNVVGTSVAPLWIGDGTTVGGVAAGAWTLDDLYDVEIASDSDGDGLAGDNLANEQHLEYDAVTQQWYNRSNMIIPGTLLTRSNVTFGDTGDETVTFFSPTVSAPNDLNINSGQLFVDQSTGFVGVGDTSPSYKLDVAGSIRATGDITIDGQDLISSTTTFNLVNTTATTVNTGGAATAYNIGHSSGTGDTFIRNDLTANQNADILGNLTVAGNTTLGNASGDLVTVNASQILMTASQPFITFNAPGTSADGVNPLRGIRGNVTQDDYWFVGAGASGNDQGFLEISVSDNAATVGTNDGIREAIVVRRYGGAGTPPNTPWEGAPVVDEMYLFNQDGYTTIPNRLGIGIDPSAKLDVNGSAIVRGTNLTVEGTIQANGGSITSSQATLTINAGGQVTIDDNVTISGNLTVNGTTTTVNSTTLTVDDKNIELASTASPSDAAADGGGITLKGTTDKTIQWVQSTGYWTFNQNIEALGGYLGGVDVGITDNNGIFAVSGDLNLNAAGGEVRVLCDLVAEGELRTHDNQITFKSAVTGAPSENVDIIVERGTSADTRIRWNESTDRWTFTNDGTNYTNLLVSTDSPTFAGATLGNVTVGVADDNTITTTSGSLNLTASGTNEVNITSGSTTPTSITRNTASTTGNVRSLSLAVQSAGTPTVGFGNELDWEIEAQPGNTERAGYIAVTSTDLTAGSEDFSMQFGLMQNGATYTTKMELDSAGNLDIDGDLTATGVTAGNIRLGINSDNAITTISDDLYLDAATNEVIVSANLRVTGDFRTDDNVFRLNFGNDTGSPSMTNNEAGMAVRRGSSADAQLLWDESTDRWKYGIGTSTINMPNQALDTTDSPSFAGATLGNITVAVADDNTITTTTGNLAITAAAGGAVTIVSETTAPTTISRNTSSTNTSIRSLSLDVQSSGTPAVGFGNSLEWQVEAQPGNTERAGYIAVNLTDITSGSEDFVMNFGLMEAGATFTTKMSLDSAGNLDTDGDITATGADLGNITVAVTDDNTVTTTSGNLKLGAATKVELTQDVLLKDGIYFNWSENNDRLARPSFQSTDGNISGVRIMAPSTATANAGRSQLSLFSTSDLNNGRFFSLQSRETANDTDFRIVTGLYTSGTEGAAAIPVGFYDFTTKYASVNPAGPTDSTDLITKSYLEAGTSELAQVKIDNIAVLNTATLTTSATTANQVIDTNAVATYRSAKYQVQITSGTDYQALEILLIHDGTTASIAVYADIKTGSTDLATFAADISTGNFRLLTTPTNAATTYKVTKTLITV